MTRVKVLSVSLSLPLLFCYLVAWALRVPRNEVGRQRDLEIKETCVWIQLGGDCAPHAQDSQYRSEQVTTGPVCWGR